MIYILNSESDFIDFKRYSTYIASVRHKLPPHVHSFASDPRYFNPTSPSSLHDAWLETAVVREAASGKRHEVRQMEIVLTLLGPCHDRRIHLHYTGITRYSLGAPPRCGEARYEQVAHGDLITHEIRLGDDGLLIHELLFETDATFLIECSDIRHSEESITVET